MMIIKNIKMIKEIKLKYKKYQKNKITYITYNNKKINLLHNYIGILAQEPGRITKKHIEAVRKQLKRRLKKNLKLWIKILPNIPISKKPIGVRMGKGKGNIYYTCCNVSAGQIIFELLIKSKLQVELNLILKSAISKLPILCKILKIKNI
jgi:large subunit ribosomal protein L16